MARTIALTVLLIEDSTVEARATQALLARSSIARFDVVHVRTLADALRLLANDGVELVLADLALHDSYGVGTIHSLLDSVWDIPVVVYSNIVEARMRLDAIAAGAQDYVVKGSLDASRLEWVLLASLERQRRLVEIKQYYDEKLHGDDA